MKRKMPLPLVLGICLILLSLCVMLFFGIRTHMGNQNRQKTVSRITELLPERSQGTPGLYPDSRMPVLSVDGTDYAALLEIPAFGITLPVADQWDSQKLYDAPRRYWGSAYDNTLVIGGADSAQQFAFCDKIGNRAVITVTDMTGARFSYTVSRIDRSKSAESDWLIRKDYDLTLFCRDTYSMEYVAVRCLFS